MKSAITLTRFSSTPRAEIFVNPDGSTNRTLACKGCERLTVHGGRQICLSILTQTACAAGGQVPSDEQQSTAKPTATYNLVFMTPPLVRIIRTAKSFIPSFAVSSELILPSEGDTRWFRSPPQVTMITTLQELLPRLFAR